MLSFVDGGAEIRVLKDFGVSCAGLCGLWGNRKGKALREVVDESHDKVG